MNDKEWNPVRKRNVIIGMGIAILVIALIMEPSLWLLIASRRGLLKIILAIVSGFVFATGIYQIAEQALKSPIEPWYGRPLGLGLLAIVILVTLLFCVYFRKYLPAAAAMTPDELVSLLCHIVGWTLIWTVLLEWVSCEKVK
ncbi:hypothetical protein ACFL5F_08830 [Planctomycetota bacterium]